jgi:predicted secreted hydrolase
MTNALIGTLPRHYERLGLVDGVIEDWEDGLRTAAADGTFEWWYFDAHLDDGSTVTVEFHTKPPYVSPNAPLTPFVLFTRTQPDGERIDRTYLGEPERFTAAEDRCDVAIGPNTFRRDADRYVIHIEIDDLIADFTLRAEVPPWRPETGHTFFGPDEEHYIAWLPVITRGTVDAAITTDSGTERRNGAGYHDHNWGNIAPRKVLDHWYWGRARIGEYTVVMLNFVSHDKYDNARLPAVMVAKNGEIIASAVGADRIEFTASDTVDHAETTVPVARRLEYRVQDGDEAFCVTFEHRRDAFTLDFGAAGAYLRFTGDVTIEHRQGDDVTTKTAESLWELLYFGTRRGTAESTAGPEALIGHQA